MKHSTKLLLIFTCINSLLFSAFSAATNEQAIYKDDETFAQELDNQDSLKDFRKKFYIPKHNGKEVIYLNGNSLGLEPKKVLADMTEELNDWKELGVEGHFKANNPWYTYHEQFRPSLAKIVGAKENEVVAMNSLTVNLHLLMISFYQPTKKCYKILMEAPVFSSDTYAVKSQLALHGFDPEKSLIIVEPKKGKHNIDLDDIEQILHKNKDQVALVLLSGVNFLTGQAIDIKSISQIVHKHGAFFGVDLAHAVGNIPLELHDAEVDFATWCSYKYLNAGPGAIAGAFVHEKHVSNPKLKRLAGWWGNDPKERFKLHLEKDFTPINSADSWQVSNPPIFAMVPLKTSLEIFDQAGMKNLRAKSIKLTGYLEYLLKQIPTQDIEIITSANSEERGCQLSLLIKKDAKKFHEYLKQHGITVDFRQPNVIRVAPTPLYNTYHEVWQFAKIVKDYYEQNK
ncbi:kynureninase [Rickettsiales endosymbiont of Stachyamoeba lipophora]|uniref:kynureninase n=1 Tax=Rickettsiales endosymbiont of Stachyamoeba lipophora TaxID=2486578 RepID=UPI000F652E77|nr:kynureninase [Rickettsiales endosymbiont of Stachyamoeba lipophora]AZL16363.1 kynureninase [Rickettsiales endosymbiont of Stachyamoeba lipophora]